MAEFSTVGSSEINFVVQSTIGRVATDFIAFRNTRTIGKSSVHRNESLTLLPLSLVDELLGYSRWGYIIIPLRLTSCFGLLGLESVSVVLCEGNGEKYNVKYVYAYASNWM